MNPAAHTVSHAEEAGGCAPPVMVEETAVVHFVTANVDSYYDMAYVEILADMILRNCSRTDHRMAFWCITDRPDELPAGVNPIKAHPDLPGWWSKLYLFSPDMPWTEGERVHYFDLDVAITGRLEDFIDAKGIIKDWHWEGANNTSVMSWDHGEHRGAWDHFDPEFLKWDPGPIIPKEWLPSHATSAGDMEFLMYATQQGWDPDPWEHYPEDWFPSYRSCVAWPSAGAKAVIMHGRPKPHDIREGWVPNVWKVGGFTSFPDFKGANTTQAARLENIRSACERDLDWFTGFADEGSTCVIVGGAPSMLDHISDIRWHARQKKTRIVSVNNAWRTLVEHGITPNAHVILDARQENAEFVKGAPKTTRFLLASQCHPDVFDALEGYEVAVWHCAFGDNDLLWEVLDPWKDSKPIILVPGGSTVGLRTMWLAAFSGFRKIHMYGVDSSYAASGKHHAYPQALNDAEHVVQVARGEKTYQCSPWMVRQAGDFEQQYRQMREYVDAFGKPAPITVHVHGRGLLPDIAADLKRDERKAAS